MGQSIISKPPVSRKNIATKTGSTAIDGGKIRIDLPRVYLVAEHVLDIQLSQTIGTNAPTSSDVRRAFSKVELISDVFGTICVCDFHQAYDQARFNENTPIPVVALGAGSGDAATARFPFEYHHILPGATLDLLTALQTSEHGSLYLQLTLADKSNSLFIGGTGTLGEVTATINVKEKHYRAFSGKNIRVGSFAYGRAYREYKALETTSGAQAAASTGLEVKLLGGKKVGTLFLHTFDTTATNPVLANGILDKITSLEIGGVDCDNITAEEFQQENIAENNSNLTGVYAIHFGDDPSGWPMISPGEQVIMKFDKRAGSPAGWKIIIAQDSAVRLEQAVAA